MRSFGVLITLIALVGCHSAPKPVVRRKPIQTPASDRWLEDYKAAVAHQDDDAPKSCALFKKLAVEKKFPAHDVASLRAYESCPSEEFDRKKLPSWLQDVAIDVMLKKVHTTGDKKSEIDLSLEKSKLKITQSEKVKWINLALKDAEALHLDDRMPALKARLYSVAPRLDPAPTERRLLVVATDLRMARQFEKAREVYERVLKSSSFTTEDKISALKGLRLSYKNTRKSDQHLASAQRLIDFLNGEIKKKPKNLPRLTLSSYEAELYRVRAMWTLGQTTEAKKNLERIEKKFKGRVSLGELYWIEARIREEEGDAKDASLLLAQSLKEHFNDPDLHDKVLWYSAWNERQQKNFPAAIERLNVLTSSTQSDFVRQRALYWIGKSQQSNKQDAEAKKSFTQLIEIDPLGYYGLLAHRELKTQIRLPMAAGSSESEDSVKTPVDRELVSWLAELDEIDALSAYLDEASAKYKKQSDQQEAGWISLFKDYARAGLYMKLFEALGTLTPDERKDILERHPELLFPQPWPVDIENAADKFGIPAEMIYAIIRQESAFDPYARSLADAFGLMQLLPEVGEVLGAKYKIPYHEPDDLFDPKINIPIGAAHLKELFQRHDGKFILAVASYNASETIIRGWMKSRYHGDTVEFVEDIPYEETRAYVRLVMRNFVFYKLMRSGASGLDFPEWLLKL